MRKLFWFLINLFVISFSKADAQKRESPVEILNRLELENIRCWDNDTICVLSFEDNIHKLRDVGIQSIIRQLPDMQKTVYIVLLHNGTPELLLFSVSGKNNPKEWKVSYYTDKYWNEIKQFNESNSSLFKFELVFYPEIKFRNIKLEKMYDWMVNISPAIQFSAWKGMLFTGQVIFPVVNQYGEQYSQIRPGILAVSQRLRLPLRLFVKTTVGTFTRDRWGVDLKLFHPLKNERFAFRAQAGLTGSSTWWKWNWYYSSPKRLTWSLGGQYYNPRYQVQTMLHVSRYLAGDHGVRMDMMRHFRYTTIGLYGLKTNKSSWNGGFYFSVALPPYKRKHNKIRVATADYFTMEYNAKVESYYGNSYKTSPDENFSKDNLNPYYILAD